MMSTAIHNHKILTAIAVAGMLLFSEGCKKKVPPPAPPAPVKTETPPAPTQPRPSISFTAEPSSIARGESVTLRWNVQNATSVSIEPGIGSVAASGSRQAFPNSSTNYVLTATGPGGTNTASANVTVSAPAAPAPPPTKPASASFSERLSREVNDAFFDYDKSEVREDARAVLQRNADALKAILQSFPSEIVQVEGHCDERGSAEYNLGLGDRRATSAKEFLVQLGVPADRLKVVTYGKERPQCSDQNEACWQKNRRAHFAPGQ